MRAAGRGYFADMDLPRRGGMICDSRLTPVLASQIPRFRDLRKGSAPFPKHPFILIQVSSALAFLVEGRWSGEHSFLSNAGSCGCVFSRGRGTEPPAPLVREQVAVLALAALLGAGGSRVHWQVVGSRRSGAGSKATRIAAKRETGLETAAHPARSLLRTSSL